MKYTIEFELPDNDTVLEEIKTASVEWSVWGYSGTAKVKHSSQQWIPVSERLPEDVEIGEEYPTVIFCTKDASYSGFYEHYCGGKWWCGDADYTVDDVIAWMPLPEPWKGEDDERA